MDSVRNMTTLAILYEKKKIGESVSQAEALFIRKLKKARMLTMLIDPDVEVTELGNYVPPLLELELCYIAVSGRRPPDNMDMTAITKQAYYGLTTLREILSYFKDVNKAHGCKEVSA